MLRKIVKTIIGMIMLGDILYVFAIDPKIALGRVLFLALIVWAWKLY